MLPFGSMNTYQKVSSSNDGEHKRKMIIWASCISVLLVVLLTTTISLKTLTPASPHHFHHKVSRLLSSSNTVTSVCKNTLYPKTCESTLNSASKTKLKNPQDIFDHSVEVAMAELHSVKTMAYNLTLSHRLIGPGLKSPMDDCLELLDISFDQLNDVYIKKSSNDHDTATWISAALTNQGTCAESLEFLKDSKMKKSMNSLVQSVSQYISNSLAIHNSVKGVEKTDETTSKASKFPAWMTVRDRKLLKASPEDIQADAVVAKDGTGTHKTIAEAIAFASLASAGGRSVIYVKAGTYHEYISISKSQKNVMLMGDGKGKSVIVGNRNAEDGYTTYQSATVASMGAGFIAKGLTIINNAGPSKQQAVALRVGADQAVVYQCSLQGYQDTLYTHSNRQFYRDNDIYGTVDFIFGNSAAVFQNCLIQPRKPNGGQRNSITAQGRLDPNQNTGISIQGCKIVGSADLGGTPTYLGRPWHQYSRTVFMQSYLDGSINSAGWEQWAGSFALSTLYYAEYANTGPGASTSGRVKWPGVHSSLSSAEASKFTVGQFIFGNSWLPGTGVQFGVGL